MTPAPSRRYRSGVVGGWFATRGEPGAQVLKQRYELAEADAAAHRAVDLRCSALIARTLLQAAAVLVEMTVEPAKAATDAEAEHLAVTDLDAAVRALAGLAQAHATLERVLADVRLGQMISAAIVRAADALPETAPPAVA